MILARTLSSPVSVETRPKSLVAKGKPKLVKSIFLVPLPLGASAYEPLCRLALLSGDQVALRYASRSLDACDLHVRFNVVDHAFGNAVGKLLPAFLRLGQSFLSLDQALLRFRQSL